MVTQEQRLMDVEADVNQLKGAYEHVATKADVAQLKSDLVRLEGKIDSDLANLENRLTRWIAGGIGVVVIGIVANIFVQLLVG